MECYNILATFYDKLIDGDINYKKWADLIISILEKNDIKKDSYLDLACGTGNLTEEIAPNFKENWAVDLSSDMLTEAENKMRKLKLKIKFTLQDICNLELNHKFNLITCCLDSTNYILSDELLKSYFKGVYDHLEDNGIFVFDINSYYKLTQILGNNIFTLDEEEVYYVWENELDKNVVDMYLTFFIKDGECYKRYDEFHEERAYTEEEIEKCLKMSGFKIVTKLDNYENTHITSETERIVYVVKK